MMNLLTQPLSLAISTATPSRISNFGNAPMHPLNEYRFSKRESLLLQSDLLWKIESGFVRSLTWNDNGDVATLGIWGEGDLVGQPFSTLQTYQLECLTPVDAVAISFPRYCPPEVLLSHLQQTEELLTITHIKNTRDRVLKLLDWLANRYGNDVQQGRLLTVRLTHQTLSELVGATRVTITRLLNELEKQGRITRLRRHQILLHN